jgi:hypothetical protein
VRLADIFISYTSSDSEWAFWIAHELEALGHTPHVHEWELSCGDDIAAWMDKTHDAANHILFVVSKAYLGAPYSNWERRAAQWAAVKARPRFALPVFVEACEAPTLLAHIKRCDLYDLNEEEARERLKEVFKPAVKSARGVFPGGAKASAAETTAQLGPLFPGTSSASNASQTTLKAEPTKPRVPPTALIVDELERRARARATKFLVFERTLFSVSCFLLIITLIVPTATVGLAGACLAGVGVILWWLHTNAVDSAKGWAVFSEAYRDPDVTLQEVKQYDEFLFERLRRET